MSMQSLKKNETARTAYKFKKNVCIYEKNAKNHKKHKTQKTLFKKSPQKKKHLKKSQKNTKNHKKA